MIFVSDLNKLALKNSIVIMGKFDGFHLGHSLLLDRAVSVKKEDSNIVLFTFDISPAKIIKSTGNTENNENAYSAIDSDDEKRVFWNERLDGIVDYVLEFPFNKTTMGMEPEVFVKDVLVEKLGVNCIIAGNDFRFGKQRKGDINTLRSLGQIYGFKVEEVDKLKIVLPGSDDEKIISSTLIKQEISKGNMDNVTLMLGRPYSISGIVKHGKHLGSSMGFPTVNLDVPEGKILPPAGVYYTQTIMENGSIYDGMTNLGIRPTINDGNNISVETNIFDFDEDIYGCMVKVDFLKFIRKERQFENIEDLRNQIEHDKIEIRKYIC